MIDLLRRPEFANFPDFMIDSYHRKYANDDAYFDDAEFNDIRDIDADCMYEYDRNGVFGALATGSNAYAASCRGSAITQNSR